MKLTRLNILIPVAGPTGLYLALALLTQANRVFLRSCKSQGQRVPALYDSGVRYFRDFEHKNQKTPDAELWVTIPDALKEGGGDCKVLAAWRAAELQEAGEDASAVLIPPRPGGRVWHVVVQRADGSMEDPSKLLGMDGDA